MPVRLMNSSREDRVTSDCSLCSPTLSPILAEGDHWRLVLNTNQNFLGKCMWVLRRHVEPVPAVTSAEWLELHALLGRTKQMLDRTFHPDHYNYAFMQNQDRHVHMHIVPRYAASRTFDGIEFGDPDWPGHYTALNPPKRLEAVAFERLTKHLRGSWREVEIDTQPLA